MPGAQNDQTRLASGARPDLVRRSWGWSNCPVTTEPQIPAPDDKDWTWVIETRCPECGFHSGSVDRPQIAVLIQRASQAWQDVLAGPEVRSRPAPDVWSALEYGSHCRDVCRIFQVRVTSMLEQDDPLFANWDQDATALEQRYWEGDPAHVAIEVGAAGASAAAVFAAVADDQWTRKGRRSNGSVFTVESIGQYFVHDLVHHLHDVGRPLVVTGD